MSAAGVQRPLVRRLVLPIVAVLLTGLAAGVMLWNLQTRQTKASVIPVAIVNSDKKITTGSGKDEKTIYAGRQLAANLTQPDSKDATPLQWILVDKTDADKGLVSGKYYAVLTIPTDFSKNINTVSGKNPVEAKVKLVSNDALSVAVAGMADLDVQRAAIGLGQQVTTNYTTNSLNSFTDIHNNLTSSAKSAQSLADSSHEVADSSKQLASSSKQLSTGASQLAEGTSSLASGAKTLASGAKQTAAGADEVADGVGEVASGVNTLDRAAGKLDRAAKQVAKGSASTVKAERAVAAATKAQSIGLREAAVEARIGQASSAGVAREARRLADACPAGVLGRVYCARVEALAGRAERGSDISTRVHTRVDRAAGRADRVSDLAADASNGGRKVAVGAAKVAVGADELDRGISRLDAKLGPLENGADQVDSGAKSVASGAADTASGASEIDDSADQLASGAKQLASGADSLADGTKQLASGADQLASGLDSGAKQVPDYTKDQVTQIAKVVTTPVGVTSTAQHKATAATSLVPVLLGSALWLGTLMMFLIGAAVPTSQTWAQASAGRRVLLGWLPAVGVGVVQTVLLLALVSFAGIKVHDMIGLALFCGLGALSFAATNQALVALFGGFGRLISLAFVIIEAAALGGLAPIESAPAPFQALNGLLPLPQFVNGATHMVIGGIGDFVGACVVLAGWMFLALAVSAVATSRKGPRLAAATADPPGRPLVTSDQPA